MSVSRLQRELSQYDLTAWSKGKEQSLPSCLKLRESEKFTWEVNSSTDMLSKDFSLRFLFIPASLNQALYFETQNTDLFKVSESIFLCLSVKDCVPFS